MEPAAPGTEDEVPLSLPTYSKKANETERLVTLRAVLPNGQYGNVFELSYVAGAEHWYCNMCECPVMGRVYHHEIGKRHTLNTQNSAKRSRCGVVAEQPPMLVAPGEPVPPGFEGEVQKIAQIQDRLDKYTVSPLIGLEYLLEIQEYDRDKEPSYLCMLCDKRGDPRTVIAHLVSYNHIFQYLQRHFIKCYQALSPYMTKQYKRNWQNTVNKIAEAIEQRYGRLKPHPVEKEGFDEKKASYWEQIYQGPHFSEKNGITFENLILKEEITKVNEEVVPMTVMQKPSEDISKRTYRKTGTVPSDAKKRSPSPPVVAKPSKKTKPNSVPGNRENRRSLSSVSSISSSDLSDFDQPEKKRGPKVYSPPQRYRGRSKTPPRRRYNRSPSPRPFRDRDRDRGVLPWQRSDYMKTRTEVPADRNKEKKEKMDKLDEYKRLAAAIENDMEKTLKQHERNPEKHPQYSEEWKIFWNKRYKELQAEGKDVSNYDFKPEWIVFWNKRMTELHIVDVKVKKDALRRRLGLPEEPAPISFKITTGKKAKPAKDDQPKQTNRPAGPMASEPDQDHEIIIIDDKDDDTKSSKRSHSPWESEPVRPTSRLSREKSKDRDRYERSRERSYDRRSPVYKRDYRSPTDRRYRRERSRDRGERSYNKREPSWERERERERDYRYGEMVPDCYKPPPIMRDVTRQPVFTPPKNDQEHLEDDFDEGDVNIVGVLRLLTALEEKLGSLGPKIIDMLTQALAMEKNEANSSETLLDNEINCVLFETVKEKLKGQLLAGLVDYAQEKAFKTAIKSIAGLVHFANQRRREMIKEKSVDPVKVPGIGTVDKAAIAKQIATALVSQGKTDVTQEQLEQLINAVVGMAEASKAAGKPMTTANFIESLSQAKPKPEEPSKQEQNKIITPTPRPDALSSMDGLSDSDLQTLLQNFKDLSTEEQHGLITYLKKLESKEPERVERLRKFVNLGQNAEKKEDGRRPTSPFSSRLGSINPMGEDPSCGGLDEDMLDDFEDKEIKKEIQEKKIDIDSEEEYSFDDVFQVAKMNVKEKEDKEKERKLAEEPKKLDLFDAKALISNIMGSMKREKATLSKSEDISENSNSNSNSSTQGGLLKAFGNMSPENVKNLENIVGNIQNSQKSEDFSNPKTELPKTELPKDSLINPIGISLGNAPSNMVPQNPGQQNFGSNNVRPNYPPQNVQYPVKNPYGNYGNQYSTSYPNQNPYNRGPPQQQFNQFNNNFDNNRFGYNNPNNRGGGGPRPRGNYHGGNNSRW